MNKRLFTALSISSALCSNSLAAENKIFYTIDKPIYLELEGFQGDGESVALIVVDEQSGKKALVNIPRSLAKKNSYSGFFMYQGSSGKSSGELKFQSKSGTDLPLLNQSTDEKSQYRAFPSDASYKNYELKNQAEIARAKALAEERERKEKTRIAKEAEKNKKEAEKLLALDAAKKKLEEKKRLDEYAKQLKMDEKARKEQAAKVEEERRQLAKKQEEERLQMELREAQRMEERRLQFERMSKAEKEKRAKRAAELGAQAMAAFKEGKFELAEDKFKEAIEFDPSNSKYMFQYGVAQYKNEKYQKALVTFSAVEGGEYSQAEKYYYTALSLMKIKEYDKAIKEFRATRDEGDEALSPLAGFLGAKLHYQKEEYKEAKENLEYVLDNSKDPKLDRQAEELLEQVENIEAFMENASKKFKVVFTGGPAYDSNVLSQPTSTALNASSLRLNYGTLLEYRPVYNFFHELFFDFALNDMYSANRNVQSADAQVWSLTMPYKWKTKLGEKAFQMGLTPGAETIYLDTAGTGKRLQISGATFLKWDNNLFMSKDWLSNYNLEYRKNTSLMATTSSDSDQTGTAITLGTAQTYFLDAKNSKSLTGELNIISNAAEGRNQKYNKSELAVNYGAPSIWESVMNARLSYASSQYPSHTASRADQLLSLSLGHTKTMSKTLSGSLAISMTQNSSNVSTSAYSKYNLVNTWTWTGLY